jgi:gluconate 5-dehydrogenase
MNLLSLFDLTGKVALVTGGSRGLGLEIASGLGEAGASVAITARRAEGLAAAVKTLEAQGIRSIAATCDVSHEDEVEAAVGTIIDRLGRIDILFNNAGTAWGAPVETMPVDKWRSVFETNVTGAFLMARAVGGEMIRRGQGGAIVNIASVAGIVGMPPEILDAIGYSASKGALISFTRDLAVKWARHGIRVNAIAPGYFETKLTADRLEQSRGDIERWTPMGRIGGPDELKGVAVFLASRASAYVTGQVLVVDGGATAA